MILFRLSAVKEPIKYQVILVKTVLVDSQFDLMSSSQVERVSSGAFISIYQMRVTADWHFLTITQAAIKTIAFVSIFYWNPIKGKYFKRCNLAKIGKNHQYIADIASLLLRIFSHFRQQRRFPIGVLGQVHHLVTCSI